MRKASPVMLTIRARDAAHARAILDAVEQLDADDAPAAPPSAEILVSPKDPRFPAPIGHTYRELCDARRSGVLEAEMTAKGLLFTRVALDAYRAKRAERRSRKKASNVVDLHARQIAAIEKAGLRRRS